MVVFNLDINNKITPSPYSYEIPSSTQKIHFRIIRNNYPIDYDNFRSLVLIMRGTNYTNQDSTSKVVTVGKEKFVEYSLDGSVISGKKELHIDPIVMMSDGTFHIGSIRLVMYDSSESSCRHAEWRMFNNVMDNFNMTLGKYYNAIKRDQYNQPNGVPQLDGDGKVPYRFLPVEITEHPQDLLYDTKTKQFMSNGVDIGIHGLKMDDKWYLTYYDTMDKRRYRVNSIYGGDFGKPNKPPEWNIWGGDFSDTIPTINAGTFTNPSVDIIDAGSFGQQFTDIIDGNYTSGGGGTDNRILIHGGTW